MNSELPGVLQQPSLLSPLSSLASFNALHLVKFAAAVIGFLMAAMGPCALLCDIPTSSIVHPQAAGCLLQIL